MNSSKFLAVCDCGINANTGDWEVKDQRDWDVPEFSNESLDSLCNTTKCDDNCEKCIVTRLREAVFEDVY